MTHTDYLDTPIVVQGERTHWSPTVTLVIAFIIALILLSPAILGLHWELLLP